MNSTHPHRCTVLVVDDETDVRETLADVLVWEGYDVEQAANGQEALDSMREHKPCLILLDLMMPVMDGWEFCRRKADHAAAGVPVVVISGVSGPQNGMDALSVAAVATKPVDLPALLHLVDGYCMKSPPPASGAEAASSR